MTAILSSFQISENENNLLLTFSVRGTKEHKKTFAQNFFNVDQIDCEILKLYEIVSFEGRQNDIMKQGM